MIKEDVQETCKKVKKGLEESVKVGWVSALSEEKHLQVTKPVTYEGFFQWAANGIGQMNKRSFVHQVAEQIIPNSFEADRAAQIARNCEILQRCGLLEAVAKISNMRPAKRC